MIMMWRSFWLPCIRPVLCFALVACLSISVRAKEEAWTTKHEAGRCAMRGQCGKTEVFFGKELPCPDNGLAKQPKDDVRKKLVGICGQKWSDGAICCDDDQV